MALTLKQDFTQSTLAGAAVAGPELTFSRGSGATLFRSDGNLGFANENLWSNTDTVGGTGWTVRGSPGVTTGQSDPAGGSDATRMSTLGTAGNDDVYDVTSASIGGESWGGAGERQAAVSIWVKRVSTTGTLRLQNSSGPSFGQYDINLASLSDDWELVWGVGTTANHAALTINNRFQDSGAGNIAGIHFMTTSGSIDVHVYAPQIQRGSRYDTSISGTLIGAAAQYTARLASHTYNGTSWVNRGVLIEEARTNLCLQSEDFTTTWVNTNTDEPTINNTAPDGNNTADEVAATSTADQAFAIYQSFTGRTAGQATVVSCFLKVGTNATRAQLAYDSDGSGADGFFCNFDLSGGTAGTATALAAGTATDSGIEDVANGWYRCWVSGAIASGTVARFTISIIDNASAAVFEAANLANNDSIIAWGAEINAATGAAFPLSYIPTTTASVTRSLDDLTTTTLSWLDASATAVGTWVAEAYVPVLFTTAQQQIIHADDGSNNDRVTVYLTGGNLAAFYSQNSGGGNGFQDYTGAIPEATAFEVAVAYSDNDSAISLDGGTVETELTGDFPLNDSITELKIGHNISTVELFNGFIKHLRYYDERLANAILENPPPFDARPMLMLMGVGR